MEGQLKLYMQRMRNSNLEIKIVGSSCRPKNYLLWHEKILNLITDDLSLLEGGLENIALLLHTHVLLTKNYKVDKPFLVHLKQGQWLFGALES